MEMAPGTPVPRSQSGQTRTERAGAGVRRVRGTAHPERGCPIQSQLCLLWAIVYRAKSHEHPEWYQMPFIGKMLGTADLDP